MRAEPPVPSAILAAIRAPLEASGAERADAPLLQPLNLLLDLAGEAMRARLFVVQSEGEAESCLRPDFTVAIAGQHLQSGAPSGRYWYQGAAFRASSGADRPEEFVQIGLEMFSPAETTADGTLSADAEIAALAWQAAQAGGRDDLRLRLGDVALFGAFVESLGLPDSLAARLRRIAGRPRMLQAELGRTGGGAEASPSVLARLLSGLSEADAVLLLEEIWSLSGVEPVGGRGPAEIAARLVRKAEAASEPALSEEQAAAIRSFLAIEAAPTDAFARIRALAGASRDSLAGALSAWERRLQALTDAAPADRLAFAPALGHAFDYYDGLTFEVVSAALGPGRQVAVGGRYDGLLSRLGGGTGGRAVGCMVRPWRAWSGGEA